jgi:hypothetical protein
MPGSTGYTNLPQVSAASTSTGFAQSVAANPIFAFAIVGVALLVFASIPATAAAAVWAAAAIFLLQLLALFAHKQGAS